MGHIRTAHYDDAHTMGLGGGVQTAVAAVALGIHVHAVIVDGDDGILRAGGNIRPVGGGVAAVHRLDLRVAGGQIPVEVRLHHDVAGIGVDELPVTVGPDAGGAVQHLEAAGIQVHLQVGLVALGGLGAQLAEVVGQAIRGGVITEGEGHVLASVEAGQPARLRHMGIIAETPCVVAVALGDKILGTLGTVLAVMPAVELIGLVHGIHFRGVEVVPLEVQAEIGVGGNGGLQHHAGVDGQALGAGIVAGTEGLVDGLRKDVAVNVGIGVGVVQAGVAGCVQHRGIVVVAALGVGCTHDAGGAHDGAVHADMVLVGREVGVVRLLAVDIEGIALQIDAGAAACAAVHVGVGGQVQGHAAQLHVIVAGVRVPGKGAVGIAPGGQLGVEHLIVVGQQAIGGVVVLLTLRQSVGEVAVQEAVLDLVAQHLIARIIGIHVVEPDDGVAAGVVLAHIEREVHGGDILHMELQRPCILGEVYAVVGGIEAVVVLALRQLGDLDGGHAEDGLREVLHGAPGHAAVGGALVVVVPVGQALAVHRGEDLTRLQVAEQVGRAGHHRILALGGVVRLAGGNGDFLPAADIADAVVVGIGVRLRRLALQNGSGAAVSVGAAQRRGIESVRRGEGLAPHGDLRRLRAGGLDRAVQIPAVADRQDSGGTHDLAHQCAHVGIVVILAADGTDGVAVGQRDILTAGAVARRAHDAAGRLLDPLGLVVEADAAGVVAVGNFHGFANAAGDAAHAAEAGLPAAQVDIAGVPAVLDDGAAAGGHRHDAAGVALIAGDIGLIGAAPDDGILRRGHHAGVAVDLVVGGGAGEGHIVVAVLDGGGAVGEDAAGAAHDTGHIAGDGLTLAVDADVLDGRAVAQAEQRGVVGAAVVIGTLVLQIQTGDLMALSVEGTAIILVGGLVTDGRPRGVRAADAGKIDIAGQAGVHLGVAGVDLIGEPLQLGAGADLVIAVLCHSGLVLVGDSDLALCLEGAVNGCDGDDRLALGQRGHKAGAIHSGHGGSAAAPRHLLVFGVVRLHGGVQPGGAAALDGQLGLVQRHAGDVPAAGAGVVAHHEAEAVEVVVVIVALRRDVQLILHEERGGQRDGVAAVTVLRDGVLVVAAGIEVPADIAVRVKEGAVLQNILVKVCGIGDVDRLRALGNGNGIDLLVAGDAEVGHMHGALRHIVEILRACFIRGDAGEIKTLVIVGGIEGLGAAHRDLGGSRCVAGVRRAGVGIGAQQVVGARLAEGVAEAALIAAGGKGVHQRPVLVVDADIQAGDGLKLLRAAVGHGPGVVLEGPEAHGAAHRRGVLVLIEGGEGALRPELPVAEHGHVDGVTVRQQDIVRRAAPAGAHQRIDVVAVVHQVLVMAPELLHVQGRGAAGDVQSRHGVIVGGVAQHIHHAAAAVMAVDLHAAVDDLIRIKAQIVHADHVEIQVQGGGTLHDLAVHIAAGAVLRVIAVEVRQALVRQIEVRHLHLQVGQHGALVAHQRDAVTGNGDIDLHGVGGRLVVAILGGIAVLALLHRDGQRHLAHAAVGAAGGDGGRIDARRGIGKGQARTAAVLIRCDLGLGAVVAGIQLVGHCMTLAVLEQLVQIDGQQAAGRDRILRIARAARHAGCGGSGEGQLRHHGQAQHQTQQHGQHAVGHASFVIHVISSCFFDLLYL